VKFVAQVILILLAFVAFYYSMYWGWASGTGTPQAVVAKAPLKVASNIALAASFVSFWTAVGMWIIPKMRRNRKSQANHPTDPTPVSVTPAAEQPPRQT
jgi:hypothetical protein